MEMIQQKSAKEGREISLRDVAAGSIYRHSGGKMGPMCMSNIWRLSKGGDVTMSVALAIADYFGVSVCEIWPGDTK